MTDQPQRVTDETLARRCAEAEAIEAALTAFGIRWLDMDEAGREMQRRLMRRALAAYESAMEAAGWVRVPVEPVREMWAAGANAVVGYKQRHHDKVVADVWDAMIAARPAPPPKA